MCSYTVFRKSVDREKQTKRVVQLARQFARENVKIFLLGGWVAMLQADVNSHVAGLL